jgi:hypothetical protein
VGQRGKFGPVQGDRPLVGGDHGDLALQGFPHVSQARLAVCGRAGRHLHQKVGFGGAKPVDRARPHPDAGLFGDRPPGRSGRQDGCEVEAIRVVDESVSGVADPGDGQLAAVAGRELSLLRVEGTGHPPANHAESDKPYPQRAHRATGHFRTR